MFGWFWLKAPGRAGNAKCCWASLRSMDWIPAVLLDASAPGELPSELAVLAVAGQSGIPLLRLERNSVQAALG